MLMALLPSLVVLVGIDGRCSACTGRCWALVDRRRARSVYVTMTVLLSTRWVAPAARLSNAWDTRIGGALADAIELQRRGQGLRRRGARGRALRRASLGKWRSRVPPHLVRAAHVNGGLQALLCARPPP